MGSTLLKSSEWYLTNRSDPHLHVMKNALLVLRLRINHYAIFPHLRDYVSDSSRIRMAEQRITIEPAIRCKE